MKKTTKRFINITIIALIVAIFVFFAVFYIQKKNVEGSPSEAIEFEEISYNTYNNTSYTVVYDKKTRVKYVIFKNKRQSGISPLYNSDGSLQLYYE